MAREIERERTYLAKRLPDGLKEARSEIIADTYVPVNSAHPVVRIRMRGDKYEITKKEPVSGNDSSKQTEDTIKLTEAEYQALASVQGKAFKKRRYFMVIDGHHAEVDVYLDALKGLVVIDFEFDNDEDLNSLQMPEVCLADVTQDAMIAGGILAGKSYKDIELGLKKYDYQPIDIGDMQ